MADFALSETKPTTRGYILLAVVIMSATVVPIFIRNAQDAGMPSLYIVAMRLVIITLVLTPIMTRQPEQIRQLTVRQMMLIGVAGVLFTASLSLLFFSLEYTSVLVNGVLRRVSPLWVITTEVLLLGAVFTRQVWLGVFISLMGAVLVAFGSGGAIEAGSNPLLGSGLALVDAVVAAVYLLVLRQLRQGLPVLFFSWAVFSVAAVVAVFLVLITGTPLWGYSPTAYFWGFMVTIFAQFIAHISLNIAVKYFPATFVSVVLQTSIVTSAILAFFLFGEIPSLMQVVGSVAIVGGLILSSRSR